MSEKFSAKKWEAFCRYYNTLKGITNGDRDRLVEAHDIDLEHQALLMYYEGLSEDDDLGFMSKMHDLVRQYFSHPDKTVAQQMVRFGVFYKFSENTYLKWLKTLVDAGLLERHEHQTGDRRIKTFRPTEEGAHAVKTIQRLKIIRVHILDAQLMFDHWMNEDYSRQLIEGLFEELTLTTDDIAEELGILDENNPVRMAYSKK